VSARQVTGGLPAAARLMLRQNPAATSNECGAPDAFHSKARRDRPAARPDARTGGLTTMDYGLTGQTIASRARTIGHMRRDRPAGRHCHSRPTATSVTGVTYAPHILNRHPIYWKLLWLWKIFHVITSKLFHNHKI
jgi:hypothetical protein